MNIAFFVRHFTARGTEVALFDYARYNEEILHNKSYIVCFSEDTQQRLGFPIIKHSYQKFKDRFEVIHINNFDDMKDIVNQYNLDFFYTITHGGEENSLYKFNDLQIWGNCNTIKHCVYNLNAPEGDFYISVGHTNNRIYNSNHLVIPHILTLPDCNEDLRNELNISPNATVFGRHGGEDTFNNTVAHEAIQRFLETSEDAFFIFMGTPQFYQHPRIKYLDVNVDLTYKTKFINTCDAMIHAGLWGETFGLSVGEFSLRNKPVIVALTGNLEHVNILGDKAVVYNTADSLVEIFKNIKEIKNSREDWNAYRDYSPEKIMDKFKREVFDKYIIKIVPAATTDPSPHPVSSPTTTTLLKNRIFCFWTGNNLMGENRKRAFNGLVKNACCEVVLITPSNLKDYILPDHPLHPAYTYLSLRHKAHYLKYYFMHFYGGGFSSIQNTSDKWEFAFNDINTFKTTYLNTSREKTGNISSGACIAKPDTKFTRDLYTRLIHRLEEKMTVLQNMQVMAVPEDCYERNNNYPIKWNEINEDIFYNIVTKYIISKRVICTVPYSVS